MSQNFVKKALANQTGMQSLISNAKWFAIEGECVHCGKSTLQKAHTNPLRALGGLITCTSCNVTESFTNYFSKAAFPIQKMPDGALPFYLEELDKEKE